jgi:hypothetical protein
MATMGNQGQGIVGGMFPDYFSAPDVNPLAPYGLRYSESVADQPQIKGRGYLGAIPTTEGMPMTELSSSFELDGQVIQHPLIVPTLTAQELQLLQMGGEPTPEIYTKAQQFALDRIRQGMSPFATPQDLRMPMPESSPVYADPFGNTIGSSIR